MGTFPYKIGEKINYWEVLSMPFSEKKAGVKKAQVVIKCRCTISNEVHNVRKDYLLSGRSRVSKQGRFILKGRKRKGANVANNHVFGDWVVLGEQFTKPYRCTQHWYVKCRCNRTGIKRDILVSNLVNGLSTQSQEAAYIRRDEPDSTSNKYLDIMTPDISRRYSGVYSRMVSRCHHEDDASYSYYGERGITVCDQWLQSKRAFMEWVVQQKNYHLTAIQIDRIDNDLGYCPENCRLVTAAKNSRNKRNNVKILYKGKYYIATDLCKKITPLMPPSVFIYHIHRKTAEEVEAFYQTKYLTRYSPQPTL